MSEKSQNESESISEPLNYLLDNEVDDKYGSEPETDQVEINGEMVTKSL